MSLARTSIRNSPASIPSSSPLLSSTNQWPLFYFLIQPAIGGSLQNTDRHGIKNFRSLSLLFLQALLRPPIGARTWSIYILLPILVYSERTYCSWRASSQPLPVPEESTDLLSIRPRRGRPQARLRLVARDGLVVVHHEVGEGAPPLKHVLCVQPPRCADLCAQVCVLRQQLRAPAHAGAHTDQTSHNMPKICSKNCFKILSSIILCFIFRQSGREEPTVFHQHTCYKRRSANVNLKCDILLLGYQLDFICCVADFFLNRCAWLWESEVVYTQGGVQRKVRETNPIKQSSTGGIAKEASKLNGGIPTNVNLYEKMVCDLAEGLALSLG
jgi:hypothetical protein